MKRTVERIISCFGLSAWLSCVGCTAPPVEPDLSSDRADAIVPALVDQVQRGEDADFAALVRALDADDPAVRFAAARSLEALTGEDRGYRFFDSRLDRQDAVARWQDWLIQRQIPSPVVSVQALKVPHPDRELLRSAHRSEPSP
ncbi:MAG: hypothetical protein AAF328_08410 [Planctomycetota bacterium]